MYQECKNLTEFEQLKSHQFAMNDAEKLWTLTLLL